MTQEKARALARALRELGRVAVAFSGGTDSAYLLYAAREALGAENVLALTAAGPLCPLDETERAAALCLDLGVRQEVVRHDPLALEAFTQGRHDRCYDCKRALFSRFLELAAARGFSALAEGSNEDDGGDFRPGMRAVEELGVLSPLRQAHLTKAEIRALSREAGLPTWNKPSMACLASRVAYGQPVTETLLKKIEDGEALLRALGLRQYRVRVHGELARIEVPQEDMQTVLDNAGKLNGALRELGFTHVSLDLGGFESGSMNRKG